MKKTYLSWLVFGLSAALVVACGSSDTGAEEGRSDPGAKPGPHPHAARHQSAPPEPSSSPPIPTWCIRVARARRSAATYFVELATAAEARCAVRSAEEGTPGSGDIAFVLAGGMPTRISAQKVIRSTVGHRSASPSPRTRRSGLFYGAVTLWQIITAKPLQGVSILVPAVTIVDAPRFAWRGLMLDSARHYQSPEYIKQFIDWMALHKLNVLHWHLTDDQAWRLEIKKYPKLTSVGAWRVPAGAGCARRHRSGHGQAATARRLLHAGSGARHRGACREPTHHRGSRDRDARTCHRGGGRLPAARRH